VIGVDLYEKVRYLYTAEGKSQRAIAKELGISRNTVKRYCQGENVPWESKPRQYSLPVTGPIKAVVLRWLEEDQHAPKKQRHTAERIYQRLVTEHGFSGSASTVRKLVRELRGNINKPYIPLQFAPGEAAQVDWGEATIYLQGKKVVCQLFCFRLCFSGAFIVFVFPRQRQEIFAAGHVLSFIFFGGVTLKIFYDNLRTAVKEGWGRYVKKEQDFFKALRSHYAFQSVFCNPGAGHEKGLVENLVGFIRRNVFVPVPRVDSFEELQELLNQRCWQYIEQHRIQYRSLTVKEALEQEKQHLLPLPAREFDYALKGNPIVQPDGLAKFDSNRYSVPTNLAGFRVTAKGYPFRVDFYHRGHLVASHRRCYEKGKTFMEPEHYLPLLAERPRSLYNAAPLQKGSLPPALELLKGKLLSKGQDKEMASVLKLVLSHGMDAVEQAASTALTNGQTDPQVIRYYLGQKKASKEGLLATGPKVEPVDLSSYNLLIGGVPK